MTERSGWKNDHANAANQSIEHPLVEAVIEEPEVSEAAGR